MKQDWILLTAGLGSEDMRKAALRVENDASKFEIFSKIITLTDSNLESLCPTTSLKYREILNSRVRGFGYMCWKAEVVYRTLSEQRNDCGIVWVDAGCEISPSIFTQAKLRGYLNEAQRSGYLFFNLDTEECLYTKKELFNEFPTVDSHDTSPQAQTTFFALKGPVGLRIASRWFEVVTKSEMNINEEIYLQQSTSFIGHRHDQSVFSLTLKESGYTANMRPLRSGRGNYYSRTFTYIFDPIIASRNRTGMSIAPYFIKMIGISTLRLLKKQSVKKKR